MWTRAGAELLSLLATGVFLFLDLQGFNLGGRTVEWQIPAIISLVLFASLVYWHMFSLNQHIHSPESQIDVTIRPDPVTGDTAPKWYGLLTLTPGMHTTYISVFLDISSVDVNPRSINSVYVDIWSARHLLRTQWVLPRLFQQRVLQVPPVSIDDIDRHEQQFPKRVDWVISAASGTITHRVRFERTWKQLPGLPKEHQRFLVAEVGGRQHRRRWDVLKEAISE